MKQLAAWLFETWRSSTRSSITCSASQSPLDAGIRDVVRRGKFLALLLDDDRVLLMHMMMSGRILIRRVDDPPDRYLRAAFTLDGQTQIRFCDPRRFGTASVIGSGEYKDFQSRLGMEPFSRRFTTRSLALENSTAGPLR